jgi:hypothetical protein
LNHERRKKEKKKKKEAANQGHVPEKKVLESKHPLPVNKARK